MTGSLCEWLLPEMRDKPVPYLLHIFPVALQHPAQQLFFPEYACHKKDAHGKSRQQVIV